MSNEETKTPEQLVETSALLLDVLTLLKAITPTLEELARPGNLLETTELLKKLHDRIAWVSSLLASTGNRQITLVDRLEKYTTATNEEKDAVLLVRQRLTEIYEQREFIRAATDTILQRLDDVKTGLALDKRLEGIGNSAQDAAKAAERAASAAQGAGQDAHDALVAIDDVSASHRLLTRAELDKEDAITRDPWYVRLFQEFRKSPTKTQILIGVLALTGLVIYTLLKTYADDHPRRREAQQEHHEPAREERK